MYSFLPQLLVCALLVTSSATAPATSSPAAAAVVRKEQLFQLVVRLVDPDPNSGGFQIDGFRLSSQTFLTNQRETIVIPKSGATASDGAHIVPETYYANTSGITVRRESSKRPYAFTLIPIFAAPPAYVSQNLDSVSGRPGTHVYTAFAGQPYFGNDPPNNYNSSDPGEGHYAACNFNDEAYVNIYSANGLTAPSDGDCTFIRVLPQCAGNFTAGTAPKNVVLSSCYADAASAPLPKLPNKAPDGGSDE